MPATPAVPAELATLIGDAVDDYRPFLPDDVLDRALAVCLEAVDFGADERADVTADRTRTSAQLMLDLLCPQLHHTVRDDLAEVCAVAAVRR